MKQWIVHYMNKYPDAKVIASENSLDVHLKDGSHAVAVRKNGAGQWVCQSEELGCLFRHDLSPIPKDSRVHKVVEGKVGHDELAEERKEKRNAYLDKYGRVKSCEELKSDGFIFDEKQRFVEKVSSKKSGHEAKKDAKV